MTRATEEDLRARLADAEEIVRAIREGEVDAVVVAGGRGEQVYTLSGADRVYRQLIETMSEGAMTLSGDRMILYCNAYAAKMLERPLDQIMGTALAEHLPASDLPALDAVLARARTEPARREISLKAGSGRLVPAYLAASRLQGEGAEIVFCLVITDLTEVRERMTQIEDANKDLESFTSYVSHDLRVPARSINRYAQLLLTDYAPKLEPESRRFLEIIADRAVTMGRLIDDLLAFSQLGRQAMAKSPVSMAELARAAIEALEEQASGRRVRFAVGELAPCEGDPALLNQVWLNLLANALKFTREKPEAVIEIGSHDEAGQTVYRVKDNGAGFDMADAGKLFKVFQRLHPQEEFEGTGVGLAIVARIVERHGGRIWARGETGRGAEFLFTLGGKK